MSQQGGPTPTKPGITKPPTFLRRHLGLLIVSAVLLVVYVVAAVTVLPSWLVSLTAGKADANTQLNAVTSTRAALLGVVTPAVLLLAGIAAFLNYEEAVGENRRADERSREEREEQRRLRRTEVYVDLLSAAEAFTSAVIPAYFAATGTPEHSEAFRTLYEKRSALSAAVDRVVLIGSEFVGKQAIALLLNFGELGSAALADPKIPRADWDGHMKASSQFYRAFHDAARADLAPR